jgi:lipopolysaccharide export system protein LptA
MRRLLLAAAVVACAWPGASRAQDIDMSKGGPIDVTSRDGMEWRQDDMMVIARGDARAVRGNVTVTADTLIARYRKKAAVPGAATTVSAPASGSPPAGSAGGPPASPPGMPGGSDAGANEIYRLEAIGNVKIFTATDLAIGDKAVYDIDQAVLLMTGSGMSVTTPNQVMTARDTMEYWSQKHMAVGRGLAQVVTSDGRRINGDVLVAYTQPDQPATPGQATAPKPAAPPPGKTADPLLSSGKLQRVEGFGHVQVRTATETITGDRGVYVSDTGIARIAGSVKITRGQNELQGDEALVNMHTGISTMVRDPGKRVEGLVIPNDASNKGVVNDKPGTTKGTKPSTPAPTR